MTFKTFDFSTISDAELTPLVRSLISIIGQQAEQIQKQAQQILALKEEVLALKEEVATRLPKKCVHQKVFGP